MVASIRPKVPRLEKIAREAPIGAFFIAATGESGTMAAFRKDRNDRWVDFFQQGTAWATDHGIARLMEDYEVCHWPWWVY